MSTPSTTPSAYEQVKTSETKRFERNEYFHGKLMTARDMEVEQDYHRDRLHALSRHVLGSGLVCGLRTRVKSVRTGDGSVRLQAKVSPGLAIDRRGRPIRVTERGWVDVKDTKGKKVKLPESDVVSVYLTYEECFVESVPVPGVMNACEERCCYNRVVEQFDVIYTEGEPKGSKKIPRIEFPEFPDKNDFAEYEGKHYVQDDDPELFRMARDFYDGDHAPDCEPYGDFSLFLGLFQEPDEHDEFVQSTKHEVGADTEWDPVQNGDKRPFVYTNDMLYAILARHVTDYNNPHEVEFEGVKSINEVSGSKGDVELVSKDESIEISNITEGGEEKVNLEVEEFEGLKSINQVMGSEGNVELVSDTITITDNGESEVQLEVEEASELDNLQEEVNQLKACVSAMRDTLIEHVEGIDEDDLGICDFDSAPPIG